MPAARMGDMATCVGPPDTIAEGSTKAMIGGKPAARLGDNTMHGRVINGRLPVRDDQLTAARRDRRVAAAGSPAPSAHDVRGVDRQHEQRAEDHRLVRARTEIGPPVAGAAVDDLVDGLAGRAVDVDAPR